MKMIELIKKSPDELRGLINQWQDELRNLRFKAANNQLKEVHQIKNIRRNLARARTIFSNSTVKTKN